MFCSLTDWRRIANRFDRNLKSFMDTIALAARVIWWLWVRTLTSRHSIRPSAQLVAPAPPTFP